MSECQYISIGGNERLARNWLVYLRVCLDIFNHALFSRSYIYKFVLSIKTRTASRAEIKPYTLLSAYSLCLMSEGNDIQITSPREPAIVVV